MCLLAVPCAFGQFGTPAGQSSAAPAAIQLPLSGRTGQSGSVAVTQVPIPGATTSVNTLNTGIQVQGPYQGSVQSKPYTGTALSVREAIQRGLDFNLAAVGVSSAVRQAGGRRRVAQRITAERQLSAP